MSPPRSLPIVAIVALTALLAVACAPEEDPTLRPEEQRLVDETLELITIRIESARDPEKAESLRRGLGPVYSEAELSVLLERLAQDPARGHKVMAAIHESLQAMRPRLFPASPPPDPAPSRMRSPSDQ